ncbi:hypothetical protein ABEB36_004690 [Hypothenemus hampei]|uniref:Mannose-6-phosphate isomerase n=1 Tax=Hypothenemus hampei TaxID=57062 RepID=A0ABD1F4G4_HYPHA
MELSCKVQNYAWGKIGSTSKVAQLQKSANPSFAIDENLNYAELWMGTHANAPSVLKTTDKKLSEVISEYPKCLGDKVLKMFGTLPFLFKVLSVNKALSIQAHPSKEHAEQLHAQFPDIYKDPNHKPEMAIALTSFEALCGFRPWPQIFKFIECIPELQAIIGSRNPKDNDLAFIKYAFHKVLTCCTESLKNCLDKLLARLKKSNERDFFCADLIERLHGDFPYDNGILMVYFLNYLKLAPLEAIFLAANEPHAYLFGDLVECMACSDNVVRAGLTPKFIDVETLCNMLIYDGVPTKEKLFCPKQEDDYSVIFRPPVPDFALVQIQVSDNQSSYTTRPRDSASILLVISGKAIYEAGAVVSGTVLFLPANDKITFTKIVESLLIYQAMANV